MEEKQKKEKQPMHKSSIYKLMLVLTYAVSAVFLIMNILRKNVPGMVMIGVSLLLFFSLLEAFQVISNLFHAYFYHISPMSLFYSTFIFFCDHKFSSFICVLIA